MNFKKFLTVFAAIGITGLCSGCGAENASQAVPQSPENNVNQPLKSNPQVLKYGIPDDVVEKYGIPGKRPVVSVTKYEIPDYNRQEYGIPALNNKKIKYKRHPDEEIVDKYAIPELSENDIISGEDENK